MAARKKKARKKPVDYDYAAARKAGLGSSGGHWPSRSPKTGQVLKKAGHKTLHKSVREDQQKGYRNILRGSTLYSFKPSDPRMRGGSVSAPRDRDLSGAVRKPRRRKKGKK
jgi:hypothetical protein